MDSAQLDNNQIIVSHFKDIDRPILGEPYLEICNLNKEIRPNGFHVYDSDFKDNICHKNKSYCELSALYSVWKNNLFKDYIGISHYRRFFMFEDTGNHIVEKSFDSLTQDCITSAQKINTFDYDLVVPIPFNFSGWEHNSIYKHFKALHPNLIHAFEESCRVLDRYLGLEDFSLRWLDNNPYLYPYNMFFGKKEIVEKWCDIIFTVLFEVEKKIDTNFSGYDMRWAGFLSERFFSLFIQTQCNEYNILNSTVLFYK